MKNLLIYLLLLIPCFSKAQSISIQDLWGHGDKALIVKQQAVKVALQEEQKRINKLDRLPLIYGDALLQRNLIIPTTPVPAIAFDPDAKEGAILPLKFATRWNSKAGVQLEWSLFNPQKQTTRKETEIQINREIIQKEKTLLDWKKDATLAYAAMLLANKQYLLSVEDSIAYANILQIAKDRFEAGREKSGDFILAQQEMERRRMLMHEARSVKIENNIILSEYVQVQDSAFLSTDLENITSFLAQLTEVDYDLQLIQEDQKIALNQLHGIRRQLLPTLTLNAYLGTQFFSNEFNIQDHHHWYGNSYANLGLKIPLSAYLTTNPAVRKAKLQEELIQLQLQDQQVKDQNKKSIRNEKVWSAKSKLSSLKRIRDLANEHKINQLVTYEAGRLLLSEYNQANSSYIKASQDVWQGYYDLIKALLDK